MLKIRPKKENFCLVEKENPELYKELFPYIEPPRIFFDGKYIPPQPPAQIYITDTTFRDGQQARTPYTPEQIEALYKFLHRLSGPKGIIRKTEFFLYTPKDREALERCLSLGYPYPEITGWIRAKKEDLNLVKEAGLKETGMLTSCSDYHIYLKLGKTRKQALEDYLAVVKEALSYGIKPRCHFEDITRADIYGFVIPFAIELMKLREESKIDIKIRLCDTLGVAVPYPEAVLPISVPKLVRAFIDEAGVPEELLEWHGHNDYYKSVINATAAWLYGCSYVNTSLLGIGERTGNTPLEAMVFEYIALKGSPDGMDTTVITEIANYYKTVLHEKIPFRQPFVGDDFNATRAGIHIDGLIKNEEIYNSFDSVKVLGRPIHIIITDKSGTAGVAYWVNTYLNLPQEKKVDKKHPGVVKIYKKILEQYERGRITSISNEEMLALTKKYIPELFESELDHLRNYAINLISKLIEEFVQERDIISLEVKRIRPLFENFLDEHPYIQFIYIVDTEGKPIFGLTKDLEYKKEFERLFATETFEDREWFIKPLKTGKTFVSKFYTSRITGSLCITVSAPIRNAEEEIIGLLGMDIRFEDLVKMESENET
ncbi:histone-lysine N-methyltransferase [Caldimicrobium thiodismutans]|uniref:Histone-lysine N-methyltransferase n=1 Tax=Caldimicrobium thiodismutans TaxID=1653476 RepID=A0A0U5B7H6_9BACT|nr:cache domain-containing protein [Caldimicrobium thiodismutans]BAU24032.1 histone-lysine N-methyltransferase [Caldimicrobium thiodismutans]